MASASLPVDHNVKADLVKARQDPAAVETLLASELHQMSIDEREKVYEEIHGVAEQDDEAPEMLAESLEELEVEIQKIKDRAAYEKGLQASPDYVTGRRFRLMFLRAKNFDAKSAAASLVIFMEEKLKYFGPESLGRPIHLSDLDRDDLAVLKSGSNQVLAARDRSGRAVFFDPNLIVNFPYKNVLNVVKQFFYLMMGTIEDEETQKRGIVGIFYLVGARKFNMDNDLQKHMHDLLQCLPFRFSAIHICSDHPMLRMIKSVLMVAFGRDRRVRVRIHDCISKCPRKPRC